MQVRANRRKKMPSCYILPFLATRIFFWTAVVMVAVLYLYSRHLIENIFDGDTINAEIPFITVLIIAVCGSGRHTFRSRQRRPSALLP